MRLSLFLIASAAAGAGLIGPDAATQKAVAQSQGVAPAPIGYSPAEGVNFVPNAFTEVGYDSNPDQVADPKGSAFLRTGVGFGLSSVSKDLVANVTANGSWVSYFSDPYRPERLSGATQANMTYLLRPGWTVSGTGFLDYDGQSFNQSQTDGASVETAFRDDVVATFLRGRYTEVRYLNVVDPSSFVAPLLLTSAFNSNRSELKWGGLYGTNSLIGGYAEAFAARVDYTDQPFPSIINRSADDYSAKAGTRVTFSPTLYTDLGWRFNQRNLEDNRVRDYTSTYFDGAITWRPSPFFFVTAAIQRTIGEPTMELALLSDIRSYEVKMTYLPVAGVTVSVAAAKQLINEIGAGTSYDADVVNATLSYDYSAHMQVYTALRYEYYSFDWQALNYDRLRILAGIRIIPDGTPLLPLDAAGGYKDFVPSGGIRLPNDASLTASVGYSWFDLPAMRMATLVGGPFWNEAAGRFTNDDGGLGGARVDLRLDNMATHQLEGGQWLSFGLTGFYAHYDGTSNARCTYTATTDCAFVNIVDINPNFENNTGPFGDLHIKTYRQVDYYGVGVDAGLGDVFGGYKDEQLAVLSPFRVGLAFRGLDERTKVTSIDLLVCDPLHYHEFLNTQYYGGFVGVKHALPIGDSGWRLDVDGTAGVYFADTQYSGRYSGYAPLYGVGYVVDNGSANASANNASFIGSLKLGLNKDLGWASIGAFAQAEYLSYVPKIIYNNNDFAGGAPWGIEGNSGTHIASGDAMNYTVGVNMTFRLNGLF